jgi:hypothetical protein
MADPKKKWLGLGALASAIAALAARMLRHSDRAKGSAVPSDTRG